MQAADVADRQARRRARSRDPHLEPAASPAVVVNVTINDLEPATEVLHSEVVPRTSQAPGFVAGYWTRSQDNKGLSMVVFDSEDAAQAAAQQLQASGPPTDAVTFDSVEVREVVANA